MTTPFHKAAKVSWLTILVFIGLNGALGVAIKDSQIRGGISDLLGVVCILGGIGAGIYALTGLRRYGRKGILIPAIIGILLNCFFVAIFASNFVEARNRATQARNARAVSSQVTLP